MIYGKMLSIDGSSFSALRESLLALSPSKRGTPSLLCQTGEPYIEFKRGGISRPSDIEYVKSRVRYQIDSALLEYFEECDCWRRKWTIYWRIPPEESLLDLPQPRRFAEDGPDIDPVTDKRCFMDRDWESYSIRMRLIMSDKPEI